MKSLSRFQRVFSVGRKRRRYLTAVQAFQIRILLIHQYRRILLKDPNLPFELLPSELVITQCAEFNNQSLSDCCQCR